MILLLFFLSHFSSFQLSNDSPILLSINNGTEVQSYVTDSLDDKRRKIEIHLYEDKKSEWYDWLPLLTALAVAYLAYRGVIKQSMATTVSSFRVKWIEDLRTSYSELLVALKNVGDKIRSGHLSLKEYHKDPDAEKLQFLMTKIKLLLNHNEKTDHEHIEFWKGLLQYIDQHHLYYKGVYSEDEEIKLDKKRIELEDILLVIFKREWDKAKKFG